MQILQSAFAWSSSSYDSEAIKILKDIAHLSPQRELKDGIQRVTWPKGVPPYSAQDCFYFIARKLLDDSQRLSDLTKEQEHKIELKTNLKLNERDHRRCQQLMPNLGVSTTFIKDKLLETSPPSRKESSVQDRFSNNTRSVCIFYHNRTYHVPRSVELKNFLTDKVDRLKGVQNNYTTENLLKHRIHDEFRDKWLSLYHEAVKPNRTSTLEQFVILLSFFAHRNKDIKPILALQAIAMNPTRFQHIKVPAMETFVISAGTFKASTVSEILKKHYKKTMELAGQRVKLDSITDDVAATIKRLWPCNSIEFVDRWPNFSEYIDFAAANLEINKQLSIWYANYELTQFIKNVEKELLKLNGVVRLEVPQLLIPSIDPKNWSKFRIEENFEAKILKKLQAFKEEIEEAKEMWHLTETHELRSSTDWWKIIMKICFSDQTRHLVYADIFPRVVPSLVLPKILEKNSSNDLRYLIGAYAMAVAGEQREKRIEMFSKSPFFESALKAERANIPYHNWKPDDYPEWVLYEIEVRILK